MSRRGFLSENVNTQVTLYNNACDPNTTSLLQEKALPLKIAVQESDAGPNPDMVKVFLKQQRLNVTIKGRSGLPLLDHMLSQVGRSESTEGDRLSVICALVKDTITDLNGVRYTIGIQSIQFKIVYTTRFTLKQERLLE